MRYHRGLQIVVLLSSTVLPSLGGTAIAGEMAFDVPRLGFTLKGVLDTPEGTGPFPVVLILPGSGPTDADGNSHLPAGVMKGLHNSSSKQLAVGLNAAGFAVARINKRGLPPSTGEGNDVNEQDYVDDYLAVIAVLQKLPSIDPGKVVIAGRSEGGPIAMLMAPQARVAGFIFIESPGQRLSAVTTDQVLTASRAHGATPEQLTKVEAFQNGFYAAVAATPDGSPLEYGGKTYPANMVRYLKSLYSIDVAALAKKVTAPSLVIQGMQDFNVAPDNGKLLAAALPRATLVMIDDMSHVLTVAKTRDPTQLDVPAGTPLHPKVIPAIVDWLWKTVPASR